MQLYLLLIHTVALQNQALAEVFFDSYIAYKWISMMCFNLFLQRVVRERNGVIYIRKKNI